MTEDEVKVIAKELAKFVHELVAPLATDVKALKATVGDSNAPLLRSAGVWQSHAHYREGDVVTFRGSCWVCIAANAAESFPHSFFRLMVKNTQEKDRDGKDAK